MDFSGIFDPVARLVAGLIELFYKAAGAAGVPSYGLAIILFTIVIKCAMYPLTVKQVRSMKAMGSLQPRIKKIQEQYKNDPMLMQEKLKELYAELGVSPLDGCLPMLIQMPVLMAVYYALQSLTYEGNPSFLWVANLSEPDPTYILPVLSAATTYIVSAQTAAEGNKSLKYMTVIMPLFIGYISLQFAAGLIVYWVTMNVVQIVQQWWMNRQDISQKGEKPAEAEKEEAAAGGKAAEETKDSQNRSRERRIKKFKRPKKNK